MNDCPVMLQDGSTPLHYACYNGHADVARFLVEKGAKLEASRKVCDSIELCVALPCVPLVVVFSVLCSAK